MRVKQVPINVWNLGSSQGGKLNFAQKELWNRMKMEIARKAAVIPVFLVNEAQIDYLYPPRRKKAIDPKRLRELFKRNPEIDNTDILEEISNSWEYYQKVVAVGLYAKLGGYDNKNRQEVISRGDKSNIDPTGQKNFLSETGAVIFLCPERIFNWARKSAVPYGLVLAKVYYHELGHAFMDTLDGGPDPYNELWGRVIEESLANLIALKQFEAQDAVFVHRLIKDQPAEYQGYAVLENNLLFLPELNLYREFEYLLPHFYYRHLREMINRLRWLFPSTSLNLLNSMPLFPVLLSIVGNHNVHLWREYKRNGSPRDNEIVNALEKIAIFILKESAL